MGASNLKSYGRRTLATSSMIKNKIGEVIVMGDLNDNLNDSQSKVNRFFESLNMNKALNSRYGKGPPSYAFGSKKSTVFIALMAFQCGYGGHHESPSDHLFPWIDVTETDIVGAAREDRPTPLLRKATSKIPTVRNELNKIFNEQVKKYHLTEKVQRLLTFAKENKKLMHEHEVMYEKIE